MVLYHCTPAADAIIRGGFRDSTGCYMMSVEITGVFFSNWPLDINEGAKGDTVLSLEIPEEKILDFEIVEDDKPYREWCIPADLANSYGPPTIVPEEEVYELTCARFQQIQEGDFQ